MSSDFHSDMNTLPTLVDTLATQGWVVMHDLLPTDVVARLREECLAAHAEGGFHLAGTGRGGDFGVREGVRSDEVMWLDPQNATPAQQAYLAAMEALRSEINQALYLGLFDYECHFARYAAGAFYRKHLDAFRGDKGRVVSCVYYLNPDWQASDGGQLRLYLDEAGDGPFVDVTPSAGTLVVFLSERHWHEVLPANRERVSLTGWFRVRS